VRRGRRPAGPDRPAAWQLLLAAALVAAVAWPATASAHALLRSSDPAAGSTLGSAPTAVTLTFGETPDLRLTSVQVLDAGGTNHASGPPAALADPPDSIVVPVGSLPDGVYTVSWRTVSSVDSHVSAGSFAFGVGVAPPSGPPGETIGGTGQTGSPPAIAARWLLYLGLMALMGAAFVAAAVVRRPAPSLLTLAAAGWVLAAIGTVAVVGVQWAEAGAPIEELPSTSIGLAALARVASLAAIGAALAALAVTTSLGGRRGWLVVGVAAAVGLGVDVLTGHAAAGPGWLLQALIQWLHGLAAAAWMGGLAALLVALRSTPPEDRLATARRFSFFAGFALAAVAITGLLRAIDEVGTLDALTTTDFGRVVLGKTVVFLGIAALGAFNRFVNLRSANRFASGLRNIGAGELSLALLVFGLSALLVNLTPPTSAGANPAPPAQPVVASGHDFGTSVRARLVAAPGAAGANTFDLALVDYDTGTPLDATAASLRFQLVSQSGVAPSTLDLTAAGAGRFSGSASNLSIDGIWQLTATVTTTNGAVEVPLLAATTVPAQPVQQLVSAGLPTIYTVQLGAAGSAQLYLDPGGSGQNDLHVTFFDPAGSELPTQSASIAVFPATGDAALLAPRLLAPGHFVATIDATPGALIVDVVSPLPDGGSGHLHVHVTIEVQP
jgi:copper transport protein